jgi:hypothetical protein
MPARSHEPYSNRYWKQVGLRSSEADRSRCPSNLQLVRHRAGWNILFRQWHIMIYLFEPQSQHELRKFYSKQIQQGRYSQVMWHGGYSVMQKLMWEVHIYQSESDLVSIEIRKVDQGL